MTQLIQYIILGIVAGIFSGLLGIGGAIILVPALVYIFGWQQHMAQGTTLAMLSMPIVILGAWQYYRVGNVNIQVALLLGLGLFIGGFFGGWIANNISTDTLRKIFGVVLLFVSIKMILGKYLRWLDC